MSGGEPFRIASVDLLVVLASRNSSRYVWSIYVGAVIGNS